jgi:uncharacterized protein YkwD
MRTRALLSTRPLSLPIIIGCVIFLLIASTPERTAVGTAHAGGGRWGFHSAEKCLMSKINGARNRAGIGGLRFDKQLGYVARRHAKGMAANGSIYHDGNLANEITRWRRLGQNTGRGASCKRIHRAFMASSSHRTNILGSYSFVGAGSEKRGGQLYVQVVFESRRDPNNVYRYPR